MPKNKSSKKKASDTSDSDSGPEDRGPAPKRPAKSSSSSDDKKELTWSLGKNRFITLREFKGKWYLDVREHYETGGELKPGKKGIMLTMEQWQTFKTHVDDIDAEIKNNV